MASFQIFFSTFLLLFFFFFLLFLPHTARSQTTCKPSTCGGSRSPPIKFPFQLNNTQTKGCGYPKFNLSCNNIGQTIVTLPYSGDFVVQDINYLSQAMFITDPDNCFAKRYLKNFTLSGSPFQLESTGNFTFYNCSSNENLFGFGPISCVSGHNYSVWMTPSVYGENFLIPDSCSLMMSAMLPLLSPRWVKLVWSEPSCEDCEERGADCGLESNTSLDVGCFNVPSSPSTATTGLPRSAKYGIVIGVGIPGLLCLIGLGCFLCGRVHVYTRRRHPITQLSTSIAPQLPVFLTGLDGPTIASYPKTLLGESRRLPKPNDNTCPICLSEYQPKETLRTIPECNHYFHADCIDAWLKLNATCPLCRNSPDQSYMTSPSSSMSSSSSSLLSP
uniref:RING-type E3 ubiquitin transferase n=1 Tax=Fagus sylvatica TaxID=28930 RepID=A0A2N9J352_FAGSY